MLRYRVSVDSFVNRKYGLGPTILAMGTCQEFFMCESKKSVYACIIRVAKAT